MAVPILRLNIEDNPKIVVKQDQAAITVTGNSYYQFTGVSPTVVTDVQTGNLHTISIYAPSGATGASGATGQQGISGITPTLNFIGSGGTQIAYTQLGTTYNISIYAQSGATGASGYTPQKGIDYFDGAKGDTGASGLTVVNYYTFIPSGGTKIGVGLNNTVTIYSPTGGTTGNYAKQSEFVGHTGDTTIHFKQSGITISQSQVTGLASALAGKSNTGHTHTIANVTGLQTALDGKSSTGHTHSQYAKLSGDTFTGKVYGTSLDLSGDLKVDGTMHVVHVEQIWSENDFNFLRSGNTQGLGVGQISGLGVLNADGSGTTVVLGADKNGVMRVGWSGDTLVALAGREDNPTNGWYAKWDAATNTFVTYDLKDYIDTGLSGKSSTGHTHTILSGLTINESQVTNLVTDLAGKSDTGHTHTISNVTGLQTALDGKSGTGHTHSQYATVTNFNTVTGTTATLYLDNREYRGFINNSAIDVSYSWANRMITLTGTLEYYWNGVKKSFVSPKTFSTGHTATVGHWFLYSTDGTNFAWSQSPWSFDDIQVAHVYYQSTSGATFGVREPHGTMDVESHEVLHNNIGTYLLSGGRPFAYTAATASDSAVSPSFAQAVIADEDLDSTIAQLNKGSYTLMQVSGLTKSVYTLGATRPFLAAGANQYIYINNPSTGAMTAGQSARWYNVYQILIPTTSDVPSQKYRMVFLQPQVAYTSLAAAQAENPNGLYLGDLTTSSNEFVIYTRISYAANVGNNNYGRVTIPTNGISYNVGNHMGNVSIVGGASTSNHANLANLDWVNSAHIGTASTIPAFNASGVAEEVTFVGSGETTVTKVGSTYRVYTPVDTGVSTATFNGYTGTTAPATYATKLATIATKTGTTYTALAADSGKILEFTATGATSIILPTGLTTGYQIAITNYSASVKTISAGTGATVRSKGGNLKLSTIYDMASAYYRGSNVWVVTGDLTAT